MSRIFRHANFLLAINILVTSWMCSATYAEDRAKAETTEDDNLLTVGSAAPELDVEHWVNLGEGKFKPVSKFAEGHVYVVER